MKNQYVGDLNDYRKYGLVRLLAAGGQLRTGVCWMLTPNDGRSDGQFITYLDGPDRWRHYDPDLFDHLSCCIREGERSIARVEREGLLAGASFYAEALSDNRQQRSAYFATALDRLANCDLVFFDPDNGLEIPSRPYGAKGSNKFLFWPEVEAFYRRGQSLLIYQHFCREEREWFIARRSADFERRVGAAEVWAFRTPRVVFFLLPQAHHRELLWAQAEQVKSHWAPQIWLDRCPISEGV